MDMYISRFFVLLDAAKKLDAQEKLELINIISVPHQKKGGSQKVIKAYKKIVDGEDRLDPEIVKRDRALLLKKLRGKVL